MKIKLIVSIVALFALVALATGTNNTYTVTAYCSCVKCCGKWSANNKTADGHTPVQGVTCAASRKIPFGTKLLINGHVYTVQDRLATKYDSRIDIYFTNHLDAVKWGKKKLEVEIVK